MILVVVGTSKQDFNRLIKEIDYIAGITNKKFIVQLGSSDYKPINTQFFKFKPKIEMDELYKDSELVISHAGIGSIITASKFNKKIIIIPRRKKYGELFDEHQAEIGNELEKMDFNVVWDINDLKSVIMKSNNYNFFKSEKINLVNSLKNFLANI